MDTYRWLLLAGLAALLLATFIPWGKFKLPSFGGSHKSSSDQCELYDKLMALQHCYASCGGKPTPDTTLAEIGSRALEYHEHA